jgi:hypothetical protein
MHSLWERDQGWRGTWLGGSLCPFTLPSPTGQARTPRAAQITLISFLHAALLNQPSDNPSNTSGFPFSCRLHPLSNALLGSAQPPPPVLVCPARPSPVPGQLSASAASAAAPQLWQPSMAGKPSPSSSNTCKYSISEPARQSRRAPWPMGTPGGGPRGRAAEELSWGSQIGGADASHQPHSDRQLPRPMASRASTSRPQT